MIGEPIKLVLSAKLTVEVAELDGFESMVADKVLGDLIGPVDMGKDAIANFPALTMGLLQTKVYGVCSIRSVNGKPVTPLKNKLEFASVAGGIGSQEMNELQAWAGPTYNPPDPDVKNEASAPSS